jgi:tetratricopeptide (TPR) repeat protein
VVEQQVGLALAQWGYCGAHLAWVGFFVLLALWALTVGLRLVTVLFSRERSAQSVRGVPPTGIAALAAAAAFALSALAGLAAVKPDESFYLASAKRAMANKDTRAALAYYEPLARWGTARPEVYENLALIYVSERQFRKAIVMLRHAQALDPTFDGLVYAAEAHLALGEPDAAMGYLASADRLARSDGQRQVLAELTARAAAARHAP